MKTYRTTEISKLINVHPNTVRLYEKWGYIEPVKRESNGYRIYTDKHLKQLRFIRIAAQEESVKIQYRIQVIEMLRTFAKDEITLALRMSKKYLNELQHEKKMIATLIDEVQTAINEDLSNIIFPLKRQEVGNLLNISIHSIVDWERNGLIEIQRQEQNRYRLYTEPDIIVLKCIRIFKSYQLNGHLIFNSLTKMENNNLDLNELEGDLTQYFTQAIRVANELILYLEKEVVHREKE